MIPAMITCPKGWTKEYSGYLAAERSIAHHKGQSNYVCVDENHEPVPGSAAAAPVSSHMIPVEAVCNPLKCPPYVNGNEFGCVVCTH